MNISNKNIIFCSYDMGFSLCKLSYKNYLNNCGFSGTCSVTLELAKKFADYNNNVIIFPSRKFGEEESEFKGKIKYKNEPSEKDIAECDLFVISFRLFPDYIKNFLNKLKPGTFVVGFSHMYWGPGDIINIYNYCNSIGLKFVYILNSPKSYEVFLSYGISHVPHMQINNSISLDIFKLDSDYDINKKKNLIFPTTKDRGFFIAQLIADELKMSLNSPSYYTHDKGNSLGKVQLKKMLYSSDYFVYPASNEHGGFATDTYCTAIHEALACGVIVITWDIACFKSTYGKNLFLIDPPDFKDFDKYAVGTSGNYNPNMIKRENYIKFCETIKWLESNKDIKNKHRKKAQEWALSNTYDLEYENFIKIFNM